MTDKLFLGDTPEQLNVKCANWVDAVVVDGACYDKDAVVKLLAERDALAAQVDDLEFQRVCAVTQATNMFDALRLAIAAFDKYEMSVDDYPSIEHVRMRERLYSAAFLNADKHLAEIRAEYGRAGFIAGFNESAEGFNGEYGPSEKRIYELANEYIESLR